MVDSVEMIIFFAEFILSVEPRSFVSLRMTSEGLRMTTIADSPITTQSLMREGWVRENRKEDEKGRRTPETRLGEAIHHGRAPSL
jgi:hypothetical protein